MVETISRYLAKEMRDVSSSVIVPVPKCLAKIIYSYLRICIHIHAFLCVCIYYLFCKISEFGKGNGGLFILAYSTHFFILVYLCFCI